MTEQTARARILEAALDQFGRAGLSRASVRAIAGVAKVSPALVLHHFGSKAGLRAACDAYVIAQIRGNGPVQPDFSALEANLAAATPVRGYLARALLDDSPETAALFDEIVAVTSAWLAAGATAGFIQPSEDPAARAALYVTWLLAPLMLEPHLARVLATDGPQAGPATLRTSRAMVTMLTHGLFADERFLAAWPAPDAPTGDPCT